MKSLRTGCQDCFIVRIVEADWHISIQSQKMGKYMTAIRHSGVAGTTINIIHVPGHYIKASTIEMLDFTEN